MIYEARSYRLSPRGVHLLEPPEDEGFQQFYLTPSFEIMARSEDMCLLRVDP